MVKNIIKPNVIRKKDWGEKTYMNLSIQKKVETKLYEKLPKNIWNEFFFPFGLSIHLDCQISTAKLLKKV